MMNSMSSPSNSLEADCKQGYEGRVGDCPAHSSYGPVLPIFFTDFYCYRQAYYQFLIIRVLLPT